MNNKLLKNIELLKKLSLLKCDILRLEMQQYVTQIDQINNQLSQIKEQYLQEEQFSEKSESIGVMVYLDAYRLNYVNKQSNILKSLKEVENSYEILRTQLGELFSEQKSYEITIDDLTEQENIKKKQEDIAFFDELSLQKWKKNTTRLTNDGDAQETV